MNEKILVPVLGESITEATVAKWLKKKGDSIQADEPIVELETDKVNLEVPSPIDGILSEINSNDGDTVEVGALLGTISQNGSQLVKEEKIEKKESNVVDLEIERKESRVFEEKSADKDFLKEEPLILVEEVEEDVKQETSKKETD